MENKMTKRDYFNTLLKMESVASNTDLVNFINKEISLLDKKNASRKNSMTETQKENVQYKDDILEYLVSTGKELTCSNIAKEFALSTQRTSPILIKLVDEGKVEKTLIKKVPYYKAI